MKLSLHIDIRHIVIPRRQVSSHMNCHIRWFKDQLGGSYGFPISHHSSYYKKGKGLFHQTRVWHTFLTSSPSTSSKLCVYFWSSFFRVCLCHLLHNIIFSLGLKFTTLSYIIAQKYLISIAGNLLPLI